MLKIVMVVLCLVVLLCGGIPGMTMHSATAPSQHSSNAQEENSPMKQILMEMSISEAEADRIVELLYDAGIYSIQDPQIIPLDDGYFHLVFLCNEKQYIIALTRQKHAECIFDQDGTVLYAELY